LIVSNDIRKKKIVIDENEIEIVKVINVYGKVLIRIRNKNKKE
jgi:hypothetical protein